MVYRVECVFSYLLCIYIKRLESLFICIDDILKFLWEFILIYIYIDLVGIYFDWWMFWFGVYFIIFIYIISMFIG